MTKANPPHIPDSEPTEAAVCRSLLATLRRQATWAHAMGYSGDKIKHETRAKALRACMQAAGWDTGEEPQEEQTILDAG